MNNVAYLDKAINALTDKRTSAGGLTVSEETRLRGLEAQRGQIDLLQMDTDDARAVAEIRLRELRAKVEDFENRGREEMNRGDHSTHRRDEYYANAQIYFRHATTARNQILEIESIYRIGRFAPDSEAINDDLEIVMPPKPQLEMFI